MAHWTASAKWAAGPALDGRCDMPLALRLSEGLGIRAENDDNRACRYEHKNEDNGEAAAAFRR